jgi:hypothetical protein
LPEPENISGKFPQHHRAAWVGSLNWKEQAMRKTVLALAAGALGAAAVTRADHNGYYDNGYGPQSATMTVHTTTRRRTCIDAASIATTTGKAS